jgi:carbon-monoxide dehydrogenase iron sulfur subunit
MACGFGAIKRHPVKEKIVKCDLCPDRDVPACVAACPNEALVFEEK